MKGFELLLQGVGERIDINEAEKKCLTNFTSVAMKLIDLNDFSNNLVMSEVIEDGIKL